jgi:glycosyltransferase involved in cell wall biosynthesis
MRLVIVGPYDGWELYLRWLAGDDPRITFTGPLYGKEKIQAYVDADVYVLPSRYEIFGLTIIEALACGTPVLITTKQGMSDMLPDFCGLVTDDLRSGLETVLDRERTELGNEVRRDFAHAFAWDRVALSHLKVYEEVMG